MNLEGVIRELVFKTSRSGGKGGQNVNKVETKVELVFDINQSQFLNDFEKNRIFEKLKNRITAEGKLILQSSEDRSQLKNKQNAIERLKSLLVSALKISLTNDHVKAKDQ